MSGPKDTSGTKTAAQLRDEKLKAALKANLARRKAQARVRAGTGAKTPTTEQD